jgi:hypothetical protein
MIRSAVDEDLDPSHFLDGPIRAIVAHTELEQKDLQFVYAGNENDYDQHVLHHFVALNHAKKSLVLAIRGTLSLSGAIVDMQGMAGKHPYNCI